MGAGQKCGVTVANLGFVGLGVMGGRIARRLLASGHRVTGYNRTKAKLKWRLEGGLQGAGSPRAVAQAVDVVLTMLTDTAALQTVARGPDGVLEGLGPGKIYIDMSTVSPAASRELAQDAVRRGAHMLDAPVSGSVSTLEEGKLSIMVGGDRAAFERVKPILHDIGPTVNYVAGTARPFPWRLVPTLALELRCSPLAQWWQLA